MLLTEVWEKYQLDKTIEGYSVLTVKTYCFQFNLLVRYFGNVDVNDITTSKLKAYLINKGNHFFSLSISLKVN